MDDCQIEGWVLYHDMVDHDNLSSHSMSKDESYFSEEDEDDASMVTEKESPMIENQELDTMWELNQPLDNGDPSDYA